MPAINNKTAGRDFLSFLDASPTPYHAVKSMKDRLIPAGFEEIKEKDSWASTCVPGGKYYLTRNGSSIVAFAIGKKWKPGNPIAMVGAHTDSPTLRIKPVSKKQGEGYLQVGVETYGGGLWHTWFDRDLGLAGRVMVRDNSGNVVQKLIHINKPLLHIPNIAPHLERTESFAFNKETQLFPIAGLIATDLKRQDQKKATEEPKEEIKSPFSPLKAITTRHHPHIVELIAADAGVNPEDVVDFEVVTFDTQPATFGGLCEEFIFSARIDNLTSCYCATDALITSLKQPSSLDEESSIRLIACFDNEEIGSMTQHGAHSAMLPAIIRRISVLPSSRFMDNESDKSYDQVHDSELSTAYEQSLACSFLLSSDVAHAVNPNYAYKYEADHKPEFNKGPVIKINANARYATNTPGIVLVEEVARRAEKLIDGDADGIPIQFLVVRNDSTCGSTIGPMLSAGLGARTVDLGNPCMAMHSIREIGGTEDVHHKVRLFNSFFKNYSALHPTILVD